MIPINPSMQALLSNSDGLTPVLDITLPLTTGVYSEFTTFAQMQGVNEVGTNILVTPAIAYTKYTSVPIYSWHVTGDTYLDASRIPGQLTIAAGTAHSIAPAPPLYGAVSGSIYTVDVQHSWKFIGVGKATLNNINNASSKAWNQTGTVLAKSWSQTGVVLDKALTSTITLVNKGCNLVLSLINRSC